MKLLKKEWKLAMHPAALLFLALSAMLLIPNYPYHVTFFYTTLGVFFICLQGRENQDVAFTMLLPVSRKEVVQGRFLLVITLELCQLIAAVPFCILRNLLPVAPNAVGLEANLALLGSALVLYGVFHLAFFEVYYKDVGKVGKAFVLGSIAVFFYIVLAEALPHIVPFIRDKLDTPDPEFFGAKALSFLAGLVLYGAMTLLAYRRAVRHFAKQDL